VDGGEAGFDVALHRPRGFVSGLGHDDVGGDVGLAEVGGRGVPELVQPEAVAVVGEQDAGAVVAEPGAAGFRTGVLRVGGGPLVRAGSVFGQEQRAGLAAGDEAGSRWAVSVPQVIHMVSPPLAVILACLLGRSRSSTFSASTALAREADS
jgi:hypothetical protein